MTRYRVQITQEAEFDLIEIYQYVAEIDSAQSADRPLDHLESLCLSLADLPARGHVPPELDSIGVSRYLELHFEPYRVIYEVDGSDVFVHGVFDGRRDMQSLLARRLIR